MNPDDFEVLPESPVIELNRKPPDLHDPVERRMAIFDNLIAARAAYAELPPVKEWASLILTLDRVIADGALSHPAVVTEMTSRKKGE